MRTLLVLFVAATACGSSGSSGPYQVECGPLMTGCAGVFVVCPGSDCQPPRQLSMFNARPVALIALIVRHVPSDDDQCVPYRGRRDHDVTKIDSPA